MINPITVYKIEHDGVSYVDKDASHILDMLKDMDVGGYYKITKLEMDWLEYKKLPEFGGF